MTKNIEERIAELEKRRDQLNARIKQIQARQSAKARKARARRLYQLGEILEKAMGIELNEEERQTLSQNLNSVITVYDPRHGTNVDMRVIDVIDSGIPRTVSENESSSEPTETVPQPDQHGNEHVPDGTATASDDDANDTRDRNERRTEPDETGNTPPNDPSQDTDTALQSTEPVRTGTRKRKTKTPVKTDKKTRR